MKIGQGAEAVLTKERTRNGDVVIKDRIAKRYRHPALDTRLREQRTRYEERLLKKAGQEIPVCKVFGSEGTVLELEFLEGDLVKDILDITPHLTKEIGRDLAKLHRRNIIHGDLTTSNMIRKDGEVFFIDFGLAFTSARLEDKAVDIHLFKQALESKHYRVHDIAYRHFLKGYRDGGGEEAVIERLKQVEARGRNKAKL